MVGYISTKTIMGQSINYILYICKYLVYFLLLVILMQNGEDFNAQRKVEQGKVRKDKVR